MNDPIDLLQIKIDKAKMQLSEETRQAIDAVDWRNVILGMRVSKGYSFEQLGDLETETDLLLCGLLKPEDYPKELEARMRISKAKTNELVDEMNKLVFSKIREELVKNSERKKASAGRLKAPAGLAVNPSGTQINKDEAGVLNRAGIQILSARPDGRSGGDLELNTLERSAPDKTPNPSKLVTGKVSPILVQKLSGSFKIPTTKTEHSLENISKPASAPYPPKADPYRLSPEE